ncbi:hypothetical protein BJ508DRAFT_186034, partial [Ascobolus immersus RN42]
ALPRHHDTIHLWISRMFFQMRGKVIDSLTEAMAPVDISFDGWTSRHSVKEFLGTVAHWVSVGGECHCVLLGLPELHGHSG